MKIACVQQEIDIYISYKMVKVFKKHKREDDPRAWKRLRFLKTFTILYDIFKKIDIYFSTVMDIFK